MKKKITTDDILNDRTLFTEEEALEIRTNAINEAKKLWGGKRKGAGRKCQGAEPLNITLRVSKSENEAIKYAREHGIDLFHILGLKPKST